MDKGQQETDCTVGKTIPDLYRMEHHVIIQLVKAQDQCKTAQMVWTIKGATSCPVLYYKVSPPQ